MAGHSQFKNIMYRKGAQDKKRAKLFSKMTREIMVSVKEAGSDPDSNARLRSAIAAARAVNMPKDNIERAIKKAQGGEDMAHYEEMRYEGYGPGGVAVIVEALTDNRNRTASEVRAAFTKFGGTLGETNSVSFQFERLGMIHYPLSKGTPEQIFEAALEAGATDVESNNHFHEIRCEPHDLHKVTEALSKVLGEPDSAKLVWQAKNTVPVDGDTAKSLLKMLDHLEDNDDVQNLFANYEMEASLLENFEA